ncbi:APC family permease [Rhodococcus qingshengii]|uniref:APC family permease n=1 Tax=Rhodococcus qingshengii TaxID=334542 RepID=UPI0036DE85FF
MSEVSSSKTEEQTVSTRRLSGNLGAASVVFMVLAAAAPLTVVGGIIPIGFLYGNGVGFPSMFIVATAILLLFAVGLISMSREIPEAGAFFTYISHGLGRIAGVAASYLAVICYSTIQVAVFVYFGATVSSDVSLLGGPEVPWWIVTLSCVFVVGVLGYRNLELSSKILIFVLFAEIAIVLVLSIAILMAGGKEGIGLGPFSPSAMLSHSPALGLMFAISGFIGFESTVVYRQEVRKPDVTIPRATYSAAVMIGIFYAFTAWAIVMGVGGSHLQEFVASDPSTVLARITDEYLGPLGSTIVAVLLLGSMFAAVLSLHNVLTRYFHSMSNSHILPTCISSVHSRHNSPHKASLTQTAISAAIVMIVIVSGTEPEAVFARLAGVGSLSIILLMAGTCLAVIIYFYRANISINLWKSRIAPGLGFVGLIAAATLISNNFPMLVGDFDNVGNPKWGPVSSALLALVFLAPILGVIQAVYLRLRRPLVYRQISEKL